MGFRNEAHGDGVFVQAHTIQQLTVHPHASPHDLLRLAARRTRRFLAPMTEVAVDQLEEDVRRLAAALPRTPPELVLSDLLQAQESAYSLLATKRRRRVHFLAGVVGAMLARAAHECGDLVSARLHARAAFACADQARHDGLRARVRALQSAVAYWSGHHHEALRHARSGAVFAARSGSTMAARLPVSEARAWAALGHGREALAAIARAEHAWHRVRPDDLDDLGGVCTFSWSRHLHFAAGALTWLPSHAGLAERYAIEAVRAYRLRDRAEWAFGAQAGAHVDLALSYLRRREVDGAAEALAPVLALPPRLRISSIVQAVRRVRRHLPAGYEHLSRFG